MPPRYAYWTIIVDNQPTAFRSGSQEDLMPTFKRLQQRNASAKMMWWQNGKLWDSRLDAQEAMRARGEMGRAGDFKQRQRRPGEGKPEWRPKDPRFAAEGREPRRSAKREGGSPSGKLTWKPKGAGEEQPRRPEWKPKSFGARPKVDWKPRGSGSGVAKRTWAPKPHAPAGGTHAKLEWRPKGQDSGSRSHPKSQDPGPRSPEKRKWVPKEEYKKSQGIEAKRDSKWRPGGEHKDPRQKYKDAKKAKWGRFKQTIRKRWESKTGKKNDR